VIARDFFCKESWPLHGEDDVPEGDFNRLPCLKLFKCHLDHLPALFTCLIIQIYPNVRSKLNIIIHASLCRAIACAIACLLSILALVLLLVSILLSIIYCYQDLLNYRHKGKIMSISHTGLL
jgi:hypothetical protein